MSSDWLASWIAFQHVADGEVLVGVEQVEQRLLDVLGQLQRHVVFALAGHAQHAEHQRTVIGHDRAAAFGDDRGMRHAGFVAHALHVVDDVVGVFLQRVVGARFEIGLRAVVVDAQPAADVEVRQPGALPHQVDVDAHRFVQRAFDLADVRDLAAQVEVQQLEAIFHAARL